MRAEVDLAHVVVLQHGGVSGVGRVVGGAVVQGAAGGEGQAGVQAALVDQLPGAVLQALAGGATGRLAQPLNPPRLRVRHRRPGSTHAATPADSFGSARQP